MRIGVIGAGEVAQSSASKAVDAGYSVVLSNSRGSQTLAFLVARFGPLAHQSEASGER
jgi:8-hydroxy-5-deazaflavin:NADPH oxidoreductase